MHATMPCSNCPLVDMTVTPEIRAFKAEGYRPSSNFGMKRGLAVDFRTPMSWARDGSAYAT